MSRSREWLSLSPESRFIVAEGSGHMVHHDRRELVLALIRDIISGAR